MAYAAQFALPEEDTSIQDIQPFLTSMPLKKKPNNHVMILPRFRVPKANEESSYEDLFQQDPMPPLWGDYREQACT